MITSIFFFVHFKNHTPWDDWGDTGIKGIPQHRWAYGVGLG